MKKQTPIRPGSKLAAEFWEKGKIASCPVYDMHGHMGTWKGIYFPCAEPEDIVRHMDRAGVKLLVFAHHWSLFAPELGNQPAIEAVRKFPEHLRAYLSIDPHYPDIVARELAAFDGLRDVFVGLKFLADYHQVKLSAEPYRAPLEFADERRLPILLHTWGGSAYNGDEEIRKVVAKYPHVTFFLGHSLNNRWHEAIAIAKEFPNTYLELTSVPGARGVMEILCEGAGSAFSTAPTCRGSKSTRASARCFQPTSRKTTFITSCTATPNESWAGCELPGRRHAAPAAHRRASRGLVRRAREHAGRLPPRLGAGGGCH